MDSEASESNLAKGQLAKGLDKGQASTTFPLSVKKRGNLANDYQGQFAVGLEERMKVTKVDITSTLGEKVLPKNLQENFRQEFVFKTTTGPGERNAPFCASGLSPELRGPKGLDPIFLTASESVTRKVEKLISTLTLLRQGEGCRWKCHARAQEKPAGLFVPTRSHGEKCNVQVKDDSSIPLKKTQKIAYC